MVLLPPVYYPLRELVTLIKGRTTFASTRACAYQRPWGYYPLIILLLRQQQYGATVARLHRIFLLFGLLVAEHYIKIDRASNRAQLWRVCAVFFQNRVQLWRVCAVFFCAACLCYTSTYCS